MGKAKSEIDEQVDELVNIENNKDVEIKGASLKDELCNYSYELLTGKTRGDELGRKGVHLIHEDLNNAFQELDIFMMHLDDYFKNDATVNNQTHLATLEESEDLNRYHVTGFKISGFDENKSVILSGWKAVQKGIIKFAAPKIKLESDYLYIEELNQRLFKVIEEVELYMDGKSAPQYEQSEIKFESFAEEDAAFENAKIQD